MMRLVVDAIRDLRAHPGRSVLTAVSLFVAVIAIVAIQTTGAVIRGVFIAEAEQLNGRAITVQTRLNYGPLTSARLAEVGIALDRLVAGGGAYALTHEVPAHVGPPDSLRIGEPLEGQPITLVAGQPGAVRRIPVLSGRWLEPDARMFPGGLVTNQAAATRFGGVGTWLTVDLGERVRPYQQQIVGVVADGARLPQLYQSLAAALWYQPALLPPNDMPTLLVHHPTASESSIRDRVRDLGLELGLDPSSIEIARVDTVAGLLDNLRITQNAFLGIAAVTLLVAILGLLNIGLATVRERSRELIIRRAIGATRSRVFALVLSGTVLVGLMTALAAIVLAYLAVVLLVPSLLDPASALDAPAFPWQAGLTGLMAAVVAALAGGIAPAWTATRVDMAAALRE